MGRSMKQSRERLAISKSGYTLPFNARIRKGKIKGWMDDRCRIWWIQFVRSKMRPRCWRKMSGASRMDPLPKEFECQSISLSPLIPSSSGTWTRREEDQRCRDGVRRAHETRGCERGGIKERARRMLARDVFDADWRLEMRKMCGEIVFMNFVFPFQWFSTI